MNTAKFQELGHKLQLITELGMDPACMKHLKNLKFQHYYSPTQV